MTTSPPTAGPGTKCSGDLLHLDLRRLQVLYSYLWRGLYSHVSAAKVEIVRALGTAELLLLLLLLLLSGQSSSFLIGLKLIAIGRGLEGANRYL